MSGRSPAPQGQGSEGTPLLLVKVPAIGFIVVRFLGEISGFHTHYKKGMGPIYCRGEECPPKWHRELRQEWKGYVAGEEWKDEHSHWLPCVVEITNHLFSMIGTTKVRGTYWKLLRVPAEKKRREVHGFKLDEVDPDSLPPAFSVKNTVFRCYGTTDIVWGQQPHLPPAQLMLPSKGPRPKILGAPVPSEPEETLDVSEIRQLYAKSRERMQSSTETNGKH